jgi:hypothetical protein
MVLRRSVSVGVTIMIGLAWGLMSLAREGAKMPCASATAAAVSLATTATEDASRGYVCVESVTAEPATTKAYTMALAPLGWADAQ